MRFIVRDIRVKGGVLLLLIIAGFTAFAQPARNDTALVQQLVSRIAYLQQHHAPDFAAGMIPSYREYRHNEGIVKNDDNIFFTGLVAICLRSLYPFLDSYSRSVVDSILQRATSVYAVYKNRSGRPTYNFWRTDRPEIFPNAGWMNLFNESQALPDDLDDTAIILLAMKAADSTARQVHTLMQGFTNNENKRVKSSLPGYRDLQAYSTWFGKKMPVDLDFCVLTNILLMIHTYELPYTPADSASLELLCRVVEKRHYLKAPAVVSPHYARTPVLLYHLSRLMVETKIAALEKWKQQLIVDATTSYKNADSFLDKVILSTALMRWGVILPDDTLRIDTGIEEFIQLNNFVFFIANMSSILPGPLNTWLRKSGIGTFNYYCPAWNYTLVLENMVWGKRLRKG